MNKKITLLLLGFFAVAVNAKSANAFSSPFSIDNTDFTVSPGSHGLNDAAGDSNINSTNNPDGFEGQFDATNGNTFLLLGATDVDNGIDAGGNTTLDDTNVSAISTPFEIDAGNIAAGKINFQFDYSFQGTSSLLDSFLIGVRPQGGGALSPLAFQQSYDSGFVDTDLDVSGLSAGNYELGIFLTESNAGVGNSAAGFDNIFVSEVAPPPPATPVPFGAAPNTGIFILGSLYAGSSYLKRRKMSK